MPVKIALSVVILSAMVYLALSRKSTFPVRLAALGALALMITTVIICLVMIFNGTPVSSTPAYPDMPVVEAPPPNHMFMVSIIVFMLVMFAVILLLSLREQRRASEARKD